MGFKEMVAELEDKIEHFFKAKSVVVFGAGSGGREILKMLEFLNKRPSFFVDNDSKKWGMDIEGIRVIPVEELKKLDPGVIVIGSTIYEDEMIEQVESYGLGDRVVVRDFLEVLMVIKAFVGIIRNFEKYAFNSE